QLADLASDGISTVASALKCWFALANTLLLHVLGTCYTSSRDSSQQQTLFRLCCQ
ncbi:hypothetical protein LSAT2_014840, partial [Lamellibrachia satsuma]